MINNFLADYKTLLCLNSDLPQNPDLYLNKIIIATDGAADRLLTIGVTPSVIIGDLDSLIKENHLDANIIHLPDQSTSDFQKAINYIEQNKLEPFILFGVSGGSIDHILFNINILAKHNCAFYCPPVLSYVLDPGTHEFTVKKDSKISLIAMPDAVVSSHGLKWELAKTQMNYPGENSCFNRAVDTKIKITLHQGKSILMIYLDHIEDMGLSCAIE